MRLEDYDNKPGKKVWLDRGEVDLVLNKADGTEQTIALALMARCGLRSAEVTEPGMIMAWGGWEDWETFREHYLGAYSPEMERRQAALVPWLDTRAVETGSRPTNRGGRGVETGSQNRFSGDRR